MPVRGKKTIWPDAGGKPTGMFGQPQKTDSTDHFMHKGSQKYALGSSTRSKPKGSGGQGLRHQPPNKGPRA